MYVFFDLDRTLLDFDSASELGIKAVYDNYHSDIKMDYDEFLCQWKKWAQFYFDEYSEGKWTHKEQKRMRLWKTFQVNGVDLSSEEADHRFSVYEKVYEDNIKPFSDVVPVLEILKNAGIKTGIITNGESVKQHAKLNRFNLEKYFDTVVVSSEAGFSKPDPEIGKIAAEQIGNPDSGHIWFVGDSLSHDVALSLSMKWNSVFLNRNKTKYELKPEIIEIYDLYELLICLKIKFRKAEMSDLDEIWSFVQASIEKMNTQGIFQWDEVYPTRSDFAEDIQKGQATVGIIDNQIASVYVLNKDFDDAYNTASWKYSGSEFAVLHRIVVNPFFQNQGIGKFTMLHLMSELKNSGKECLRLDVFSENPYSQKLYDKLGFINCGEAHWRKGLFFLMERLL